MQPEDSENVETAPEESVSAAVPEWLPPDTIFTKPPVEREPFWDYFDLFLMIGLMFASLVVVLFAARGWTRIHPSGKNDLTDIALPVQFAVYGMVYVCFYVLFKLRYDRPVFRSLGFVKTGTNLVAAGAGGVLLAFAIDMIAALIHTPKVDTPFDELLKTPISVAMLAVTAVVAAPLFEEMVFRGFLQPLVSRTVGAAAGIVLTAALFGGVHASEYQFAWQYVAAITIVGIVLGVMRARTKSTIPGTVLHGCFNAVPIVALIISKFIPHK
jgi:membrane protease YdiL (CAAX protease family)